MIGMMKSYKDIVPKGIMPPVKFLFQVLSFLVLSRMRNMKTPFRVFVSLKLQRLGMITRQNNPQINQPCHWHIAGILYYVSF